MKKLLIATSLMLTGIFTANAEVELIGCSYASSVPGQKSGLYRISTTSPTLTMISDKPQATGGGVYGKGKYYCQWYISFMGVEAWANMEFDAETWEMKGGTGARDTWAFDLAYDDSTDRIYGCFHESDENYEGQRLIFGWINASDYIADFAPIHPVSDVFVNMAGMDFDSQGQLWAISREGQLFKVDKETGEMTNGINTGLKGFYDTSATIDRETDTMYYFLQLSGQYSEGISEDKTSLYKIDLATGEATWVYDLPGANGIQGLSIFVPQAPLSAPAPATGVTPNFDKGNLTGTLSFNVPATTYGGNAASGLLSYKVFYRLYGDDEAEFTQLATGRANYGETATANVTLPANGQYQFAVQLFNLQAEGSPRVLADTFVGYDNPLSPQDVKAEETAQGVHITWGAPTASLHNGYMDAENLKYNVVRMPDEITIATGISALEVTDNLQTPEEHIRYTYEVTADNNGMLSAASKSNVIGIGPFNVPYACDFDDYGEFNEYTVLPKEEYPDFYYQWTLYPAVKAARLTNTIRDDDDWLITPPVRMEAGKTYEVIIEAGNDDERDNYAAHIEVAVGSAPTRASMKQGILIEETSVATKKYESVELKESFRPVATGSYHVGIHSVREKNSYIDTFIYSIRINDITSTAVGNIEVAEEGAVEYYSIDGRRLDARQAKGLVIVRQGNKSEKRIIR